VCPPAVYAYVTMVRGGRRVRLGCHDGVDRLGYVPGRLKRRRFKVDDLVVGCSRPFETVQKGALPRVDILHVYSPEDARRMRERGIVSSVRPPDPDDPDCPIDFELL
jgi:initiation factor 1A